MKCFCWTNELVIIYERNLGEILWIFEKRLYNFHVPVKFHLFMLRHVYLNYKTYSSLYGPITVYKQV